MLAHATQRFVRCMATPQNSKAISTIFRSSVGVRAFSSAHLNTVTDHSASAPSQIGTPGYIEKPLKALDLAAVRQIKAELMAVDANSDGKWVEKISSSGDVWNYRLR